MYVATLKLGQELYVNPTKSSAKYCSPIHTIASSPTLTHHLAEVNIWLFANGLDLATLCVCMCMGVWVCVGVCRCWIGGGTSP